MNPIEDYALRMLQYYLLYIINWTIETMAVLFYYPQIVSFLQDQQTQLTSFKFNFVLTVIYESPLVISPQDDAKSIEKHEMYRKGKKFIFLFLIVGLIVA